MKAEHMFISCMDSRIQEDFFNLIVRKNLFGKYYPISMMGSSLYFLQGREKDLFDAIETAMISTLVVIHHGHCKAYKIPDIEQEKEIQIIDMGRTETIVKSKFPTIKVIKVWADLDNQTGKVISFQRIPAI